MTAQLPQQFVPSNLPTEVSVCEVSARDGLQSQARTLPVSTRLELIRRLSDAGLKTIEAGSFVSPRAVPQMADTRSVLAGLDLNSEIAFPVLVPNRRGLDDAVAAGAKDASVFISVTESFAQANLGGPLQHTTDRSIEVARAATAAGMRVRGYLSMVFGDPWEGAVDPEHVATAARRLVDAGCLTISLGDTIGTATPGHVTAVLDSLVGAGIPIDRIALHTHNTYGQALANVYSALQAGVSQFDASAGGIGGCPFARTASGNLATEDLLWMLQGLGISTGVDIDAVATVSQWLGKQLGIPLPSATSSAVLGR
ncbi:hydroxymethylglutaryl-CoA lyase [Brevibacterium linens]|uniref:Hydroxymethylglutaryl-CoA lyase n=1 Tax=Brevibacterium linens ATCC 9172 TaxID=1255617 RepID=A0A2H1JBP2_BRELN|nr:hydroxymethylglutaryl-CoA lyase [Brevibacterium linens]KAB1948147.1 hydroxymethylglutaryl-CoA lyase [Brevibacterium linens ATCC 9172]SMX84781.1 hydroxymethylglutaryl-CoA lyase [Brevibacterium linens ATCC 9172]